MRPLLLTSLLLVASVLWLGYALASRVDDVQIEAASADALDRLPSNFPLYVARLHDRTPPTAPTTKARKTRPTTKTVVYDAAYPTDELLYALAMCETGGTMDPTIHSPSGRYHGAFQFDIGTWWSVGGEGDPHEHPYEVQRDLARTLILQAGWSQFPTCSRAIGAR